MESLDSYYAVQDAEGEIVAGAGISGDVLKCLAVAESARSEGLLVPLVSRIISEHPGRCLKVFTKPKYQAVFESMGFRLLAQAPLAILLENGHGLEQYCQYLRGFARDGRCGVVVMNANPFTLGHQYLLQKASEQVDHLFVIPVKEDLSEFSYAERRSMIISGVSPVGPAADEMISSAYANLTHNITVLEGCDYVISAATFPTYFLKDLSEAAVTQMKLDLDLFGRWIAPALGASVRFVGSEPFDALTNQYNQLIPNRVEIPRLEEISATKVRRALAEGCFKTARVMCPVTTWPYLLGALADRALRRELETQHKPGLVCPESAGAHRDMNYDTMLAGIRALRPFWPQMALAASARELMDLGIEAEKAMLAATGGVNTHRGAIFCMGLALNAACGRELQFVDSEKDMQIHLGQIAEEILRIQLYDNNLHITPKQVHGARKMAVEGYRQLFEDWLPFYRSGAGELKTLLRIMSTLDDTCVVKRVGAERALEVKEETKRIMQEMADQVGHDGDLIGGLCERYAAEGISPGGAADMLALTMFIQSIY